MLAALQAAPSAHVAFSSVDVHLNGPVVDITVVVQAFDVAHELGIDPPERLMDLAYAASERDAMARLVEGELDISAGGEALTPGAWTLPAVAPDQQLIRIRTQYDAGRQPGRITIASRLFAYDTAHQTLVNVYEGDTLKTQQILDASRVRFEYFTATREGLLAVAGHFAVAGLQRALSGYGQVLFVAALLLLGGTAQRAARIAAAFALSCFAALALAASGRLFVPAAVVVPGVALSVVYASVDNLMIRGGRDVRGWTALGFGWLHGLSLAGWLDTMDRPQAFARAAASFSVGAAAGMAMVAVGVLALAGLASRNPVASRLFVRGGSAAAAAAGVALFVLQFYVK
jgi:hypothetical protein